MTVSGNIFGNYVLSKQKSGKVWLNALWDRYARDTMHYGMDMSWDRDTMHYGIDMPWDRDTMHYGMMDMQFLMELNGWGITPFTSEIKRVLKTFKSQNLF